MAESKVVYRPRRDRPIFLLAISFCFATFSLLGLLVVGWESWYFYGLLFALGVLGMAGGWGIFALRVVVDDAGIAKVYRLGNGFKAPWNTIDSWIVAPYHGPGADRGLSKLYGGKPPWLMPPLLDMEDSFTFKAVLFKIRGRRWPAVVYDCEVSRPGFEAFVEALRAHIKAKEIS